MNVFKHLKSIFPFPSKWQGDEKAFALRLEEAYRWIQLQIDALQKSQDAFMTGQDMPTGTDLDDIKAAGSYWFSATAAAGADNAPLSSAFQLLVIVRRKTSTVTAFDQIAITSNKLFIRVTSGNGWTSWKEYNPIS